MATCLFKHVVVFLSTPVVFLSFVHTGFLERKQSPQRRRTAWHSRFYKSFPVSHKSNMTRSSRFSSVAASEARGESFTLQVPWREVGGLLMYGSLRKQATSSFKRNWGRRCKKQGLQLRHRSSGLSTTCSVDQSITCSLHLRGLACPHRSQA